ncbi:unnamed protein product [Cylicostephanus goldi]|uniref:Uncharacterized protein n=1 Tax=Cylicostephanus goldi TaxID=71465 RepID=A0A3P6S0I1_CYLGO|nr:unnamed protein product [Cylicostephanus goldi]
MSPKAPTNQRKKSNASVEADRRLARAQQIMDGNLERPAPADSNVVDGFTGSNTSTTQQESAVLQPMPAKREDKIAVHPDRASAEPPRQRPQPVAVAPVQLKRSDSQSPPSSGVSTPPSPKTPTPATAMNSQSLPIPANVAAPQPTSRPSVIPVSAVHPTVYTGAIAGAEPIPIPVMLPVIPTLIPGLTLPIGGVDMTGVSLGALAEYYGQFTGYDDSNLPPTPTPSLASSVGNDRAPNLLDVNASPMSRSRQHSDSEQSVASELSAAPDWLDEVVGPGSIVYRCNLKSFHQN